MREQFSQRERKVWLSANHFGRRFRSLSCCALNTSLPTNTTPGAEYQISNPECSVRQRPPACAVEPHNLHHEADEERLRGLGCGGCRVFMIAIVLTVCSLAQWLSRDLRDFVRLADREVAGHHFNTAAARPKGQMNLSEYVAALVSRLSMARCGGDRVRGQPDPNGLRWWMLRSWPGLSGYSAQLTEHFRAVSHHDQCNSVANQQASISKSSCDEFPCIVLLSWEMTSPFRDQLRGEQPSIWLTARRLSGLVRLHYEKESRLRHDAVVFDDQRHGPKHELFRPSRLRKK